jgi:hypothetical protein
MFGIALSRGRAGHWQAAQERRSERPGSLSSYRRDVDVYDLKRASDMLGIEDPRIAPGGPMARYVGDQLTESEVLSALNGSWADLLELAPVELRSIRSFPIPSLRGVRLTCRPDEFNSRILQTLRMCLPGTTWPSYGDRGTRGLVEKYMLLDGSYQAPSDPVTGQDMVIELYGRLLGQDGSSVPRGRFPELISVTIEEAHWANVSGLSVGVPFYM